MEESYQDDLSLAHVGHRVPSVLVNMQASMQGQGGSNNMLSMMGSGSESANNRFRRPEKRLSKANL